MTWSGRVGLACIFVCNFRILSGFFWVSGQKFRSVPDLSLDRVGSGRIFSDGSSSGRTAHDQAYGRYKNTNSQTNGSIKYVYISNTYGGVMQMKSNATR